MVASVSRRQFLAVGGGLTMAGALAACSSPIVTSLTGAQPSEADVIFWNLFGGGDGANMLLMVNAFRKANSGVSVESTTLPWGNPYYTKLALAAASGRTPDVAIAHLSRLPLLAQAGLVSPVEEEGVGALGITKDKFTPAAWSKATVNGTVYAVPLDTHPFVLFYNVDVAKKAGLLNAKGDDLKPMSGKNDFLSTLKAMKDATGQYGAVMSITADPATCWRFFSMIYSGIAGPIVSDQGTKITLDNSALEETFDFMQSLTKSPALMPGNIASSGVSSLFSSGKAGFLFDGEWQIPTYRGVKLANGKPLNFNVVPFPALLGKKPVAYADSHSLVIPHNPNRSKQRTQNSVKFIKGLLDNSPIWAGGGHIPAWLPVQKSPAFLKQKPQSNYIQAAFNAVYDPVGWYTGAGSDFQTAMGAVIMGVLGGGTSPKAGAAAMRSNLKTFTSARPPVK
jgi:multiple sugar transport system substrate-binding protein